MIKTCPIFMADTMVESECIHCGRSRAAHMTPEEILIEIAREHPDFYERYVIKHGYKVVKKPQSIIEQDMQVTAELENQTMRRLHAANLRAMRKL